jgi:thiamine-phosphate pyrophosphorylase
LPALPAAGLFPLYAIIDTAACASRGLDPRVVTAAYLRGGARLLQLRGKTEPGGELLALADDFVAQARRAGAALVVNDRADVARLSGAAGVHVGQDDLGVEEARAIVGVPAIVGVSTHDEAQIAAAAASSASYIAVGPIFETATKATGYGARGLALVRRAAVTGKPVVAIGGITLDRAAEVVEAGATSVAVISDLLEGGDPEARVRAYVARLSGRV